jgi:hypothetical protein
LQVGEVLRLVEQQQVPAVEGELASHPVIDEVAVDDVGLLVEAELDVQQEAEAHSVGGQHPEGKQPPGDQQQID